MSETKTATVLEINPLVEKEKKAGGTYECFHMKLQTAYGVKDEYIASFSLTKNPVLEKELKKLSEGDVIQLEYVKVGQYNNLVKVTKAEEGSAPVKDKPKVHSGDPTIGITVGMAINNAALLKAHGQDKRTIKEIAEELIRLAVALKKDAIAGMFENVPEVKKPTKKAVDYDAPPLMED